LSEVHALRSASRAEWQAAARAPHWATVREVVFNQSVPRWFITEWAKNPAIRHVGAFIIDAPYTMRVVRRANGWHITRDNRTTVNFKVKRAFKEGLPAGETFDFPPDP
jgi:hypothetical protein